MAINASLPKSINLIESTDLVGIYHVVFIYLNLWIEPSSPSTNEPNVVFLNKIKLCIVLCISNYSEIVVYFERFFYDFPIILLL